MAKTLKLFRGIAVPSDIAASAKLRLLENGLVEGQGNWRIEQPWRVRSGILVANTDASRDDPRNLEWRPAICACGTPAGAAFYSLHHNRSTTNNTPILIEFEAHLDRVRVDGRDFLYPAFQMGQPEKARTVLQKIYGDEIVKYADRAWATQDQTKRIAMCDLATMDPEVVLAHYSNRKVIVGRFGTVFENAFTVALPVDANSIICVRTPDSFGIDTTASVSLDDVFPDKPSP